MVTLWQGLVASLQGNTEQSGRGARLTSVTHTLSLFFPVMMMKEKDLRYENVKE